MDRFPKTTDERPPPVFDGETNIALAPMVCGAAAVKRFFEDKSKDKEGKKVTKTAAAKELGLADGTIKNMLTAGKLKGDGKGGVEDGSVAAFLAAKEAKKAKLVGDSDDKRREVESLGSGADGVVEDPNADESGDGIDRGRSFANSGVVENHKTATGSTEEDRENSGDIEASNFFGGHVREPFEDIDEEEPLATFSLSTYKKGYELGFEAGAKLMGRELMAAQSVSADDILAVLGEKAAV